MNWDRAAGLTSQQKLTLLVFIIRLLILEGKATPDDMAWYSAAKIITGRVKNLTTAIAA